MRQFSILKGRKLNADFLACLVLTGVGILFFYDFLFSSKNFYFRDILNFHYPLRKALIDSYARGELPLWNPYVYMGQPMLANPNYMAFYPTNLFHLILPFNYAFKLHFIIHPILAGLGAYFLGRRLGIASLAAFTGALAYEFSGTVLSFLNLYNLVPAVALLPWIGWAFLGALKDRWLKRSLLFGALLALQAIAFEPILFQCVLWLLFGLASLHVIEADNRLKGVRVVGKVSLLGAGFGAGLAAVQVIPTLELFPLSARVGLRYVEMSSWSMHPLDFLNTLIPNLFGNYYTISLTRSWGGWIHHGREGYLVSFFLGTCALLIAAISFVSWRKKAQRVFLTLACVSALLALGRFNPVYHWLYQHIPYFGLGRFPSKYFLLGTLALCIMTSLGAEVLFEKEKKPARIKSLIALAGVIAGLTMLGCWIYFGNHPSDLENLLRYGTSPNSIPKDFPTIMEQLRQSLLSSGVFLVIGSMLVLSTRRIGAKPLLAGLLPVLIAAELIPSNLRLSPLMSDADVSFTPEVNRFIEQNGPKEPFRVMSLANLKSSRSLAQYNLYAPNRSSAWLSLFFKMSGQPLDGIIDGIQYALDGTVDNLNTRETETLWIVFTKMSEDATYDLLRKINAPMILSLKKVESAQLLPLASFDTSSDRPVFVYWLKNAMSRAYFASGFEFAESQEAALVKFLAPDFAARSALILEGRGGYKMLQPGSGKAEVLEYRSSRIVCEVDSKIPGHLVLLDSYYPGWRVFVDGKESSIIRANFAFRAVRVPAGRHRVEFAYRPRSFLIGCIVTLLTLLCGIALALLGNRNGLGKAGTKSKGGP